MLSWIRSGSASSRHMDWHGPGRSDRGRSDRDDFGRPDPDVSPCLLGSAKANVGHLEAAAGVIGLIKAVLALGREAVPPQVHFNKLNPHISLAGTRLEIPTSLTPWPRSALPRCAAVSSFGIGGTNAHVIVEEAPHWRRQPRSGGHGYILPLSARSIPALRQLAQTWTEFLTRSSARSQISVIRPLCAGRIMIIASR